MTTYLIVIAVLVVLSALFSGTETAFTSISFIQVKEMETSRIKRKRVAAKLAKQPDILLTTILIGNNLVNIAASALTTTMVIIYYGSYAVGYATGLLTLIILIFAEITPKQIAIIHNVWIASHMAYPILLLSYILYPLVQLVNLISKRIASLFSKTQHQKISLQGILHVVNIAEDQGVVENYETELVRSVFRFDNIHVRTIMTHRTEITSIDGNAEVGAVFGDVVKSGHSRIPVYIKHPEEICGILLVRDLLKAIADDKSTLRIRDIMETPLFVSENKKVHEMFFLFKSQKLHMAVVLDEYGGLAGVVTLEDVMEVLFGELYDEHEVSEGDRISKIAKGVYIIQGETSIQQFEDYFHIKLSHSRHVTTLGGYVLEVLGQIPAAGQSIDTPLGIFTIQEMAGNRIELIRFRRQVSA